MNDITFKLKNDLPCTSRTMKASGDLPYVDVGVNRTRTPNSLVDGQLSQLSAMAYLSCEGRQRKERQAAGQDQARNRTQDVLELTQAPLAGCNRRSILGVISKQGAETFYPRLYENSVAPREPNARRTSSCGAVAKNHDT